MKKKNLAMFLAATMAVASLAGCGGSGNEQASGAAEGEKKEVTTQHAADEIHVVRPMVTSFDPWEGYDNFNIYYQIYDQLVGVNEAGEVIPDLAESWEKSEDGTEYTFKLREDVTFTNGDPMTAEDVAYSINKAIESPGITALTTAWKSAEAIDDYTVKITLDYAYNFFLPMLSTSAGSIVNKDVVEAAGCDFAGSLEGAGTGAFVVKEFVSGSHLTFSTWPGYDDEPVIERDIEKAKQLLSEAGYGDGCTLSLTYDTEYLATFPDAAVLLQSQLAEVGINLEINPLNKSAFTDQVLAGAYGDMILHANGCFNDPFSWYDYLMSEKAIGSTNHTFWSSEKVDELIVKGRTSQSDEEVAQVLDELREELWKEWPIIPICSSGMRYAAFNSNRITGCTVDFDFDFEMYNWQLVK